MKEPKAGDDRSSFRDRLRAFEPTSLGYLGFLAVPGWVAEPLAGMRIFGIFFLFWLWPVVPAVVMALRGGGSEGPAGWVDLGGRRYHLRFLVTAPLTWINPFVMVQAVRQLLGAVRVYWRFGQELPHRDSFEHKTSLRLPFSGTWTVLNGSLGEEHSHSWEIPSQRYAYDFVITDEEGRTRRGDGRRLEDYHCFGEPLMAPAAGRVVEMKDDHRDAPRPGGWLDLFQGDIRGNYVVIRHAEGEYSLLAHLQRGSIPVGVGAEVERGQVVGRCGNSGNSTEPHLHFQVQDRRDFLSAMSLPVRFDSVETVEEDRVVRPPAPTAIEAGERVRPTET